MAKLTIRAVKEKTHQEKEKKTEKEETVLSPSKQQQKESLKSPVTPGSFKNLKQQKLSFVEYTKTEVNSPAVKENLTPPPTKKRRRSIAET